MSHANHLNWAARLDRRLVSTRGGTRHVLVDVQAPRIERDAARARPPLNLGLVIDASGSMSGEPLEAAKTAARGVIQMLREGDRVTVVSFADDVIIHADAVPADASGRQRTLAVVDDLVTRGCTDLGAGWLEGCDRVARVMEELRRAQNRVIVLSDGHANRGVVDPEQLGIHAAQLRLRGLYSSAVGIGDHYSPAQLQAIAEQGGGRLHDAPLGEDIVAVVLGELGEILATAADAVALRVTHPRRLPVSVLGPYPRTVADGVLEVAVGTLISGASRQLVLQVTVPPGVAGERFRLEIAPSWRTPEGEPAAAAPLVVSFGLVPAIEVAAELPDRDTCLTVARMWHRHVLLESTLRNSEGRYDEARAFVREALPAFRDYSRDLPGAEHLIQDLESHAEVVRHRMMDRASKDLCMLARCDIRCETDHRVNRRGGRK